MKNIWTQTTSFFSRHHTSFRYVRDAVELLFVVYGSMVTWGILAEFTGISTEILLIPGLISTVFCVYLVGRIHNSRHSKRIKRLYDKVKSMESQPENQSNPKSK